jgi:hypothetical protein
MNTPNIDLLLSDITFRRGWLAKMLEVTVHDGDDTRFDAVSIVDLIHEIRALRQQRDEARVVTDAMEEAAIMRVEVVAGPGDVCYRLVDSTLSVWVGNGLSLADDDVVRVAIAPDNTTWVMTAAVAPTRGDA